MAERSQVGNESVYVWDSVVIYVSKDCLETGSMNDVESMGIW